MTHLCIVAGDNTEVAMTDWVLIRWALLDLRLAHEPNKAAFARVTGIHRGTIARIEDVIADPEYKSDLDTIQKWVEACDSTLGEFFTALAGDRAGHLQKEINSLRNGKAQAQNKTPPQKLGVDEDGIAAAVRESPEIAIERMRYALREAGSILFDAGVQDVADDGEFDPEDGAGTAEKDSEGDRLPQAPARKRKQG